MGLAGRKQKQRIPADPRNLSWADDASRFGQSYLSKFGWDSSQGLGTSGEGIKSHIKVSQKLDMMGIGAAHQLDPHGIAWKQNRDFEALLERLNGNSENKPLDTVEENFIPAAEKDDTPTDDHDVELKTKEKEAKRKREINEEEEQRKSTKKRKKEKRKNVADEVAPDGLVDGSLTSVVARPQLSEPKAQPRIKGLPMAHRARIQAAKHLANKSAAAISEILGIDPTPSPSTSTSATRLGSLTPAGSEPQMERITTSAQSLGDYFKEKLGPKSGTTTPAQDPDPDANGFAPRGGLGSRGTASLTFSDDADRSRSGLSKISNLFVSSLFATPTLHTTVTEPQSTADIVGTTGCVSETDQKPDLQQSSSKDSTDRQREKAHRKKEKREKVKARPVDGEHDGGDGAKGRGRQTKMKEDDHKNPVPTSSTLGDAKSEKRKKHHKSDSDETCAPNGDRVVTEPNADKKAKKKRKERDQKASSSG